MFISFILDSSTTSNICPNITDLPNIFMPFNSFDLFVAANGSFDPSSITDNWLRVTYCTYEIGSSNEPQCGQSVSSVSEDQCYIRLDIQIAYANIGAINNAQPILGAVAFHYQRIVSEHFIRYATLCQSSTSFS